MNFIYPLKGTIDSSNADAFKQDLLNTYEEKGVLELDASELKYISSAGLRALLALAKKQQDVVVNNVSTEVYEIFEVTGFTELLTVNKRMREISIEGCKKIGQGGNGAVYRIDDETIVKVFREGLSLEEIVSEREYAKAAFVAGVPTAIPFDTVKVGDRYGNVYELMNSDTLGHAFVEHPEKYDEYIDKYVALIRTLGNTKVEKGTFDSYKNIMLRRMDSLEDMFEEEDIALIKEIIECMKDTDTLVHGDLHVGNIMIQDDELMLIDMADMTTGSPVNDIVCIYRDLYSGPSNQPQFVEQSLGIKADLAIKIFYDLMRKYYNVEDDAALEKCLQPIGLLYALNAVSIVSMATKEVQMAVKGDMKVKLIDGVLKPYKDVLKQLVANM